MNQPHDEESEKRSNAYDAIADKIGLVPNVRARDNLYQGLFVLACVVVGVMVGFIVGGGAGAVLGLLAGLVGGGFVSGFALMIIGLRRK